MNRLISPDPRRKESLWHARWLTTLYQAAKPDPASAAFSARVSTLVLIANTIRERLGEGPADISGVMAAVISQECDLASLFRIADNTSTRFGNTIALCGVTARGP